MERLTLTKSDKGTEIDRSLVAAVDALPLGKYDIIIVRRNFKATVPQKKLFWMWMACLEEWSGESRVKWHDHYCRKFLSPDCRSTRNMSTIALWRLMRQIQADAASEWGVSLPCPEDRDAYNCFVLEYQFL